MVIYAIPLVEDSIAAVADDRSQRDRWRTWYEQMLALQIVQEVS
jgi:hypothetical protein